MLTEAHMSHNQVMAVQDIWNRRKCLITSDCGFGKTVTIYTVVRDVMLKTDKKILLIGNKMAAEGALLHESQKWEHLKHIRVVSISGSDTPKQRARKLLQPADVHVCSYHMVKWLLAQSPPEYVMVAADEMSCMRGASSKWRAWFSELTKHAQIIVGMTATPKTREEDDYWGVCKAIDGGETLGENLTDFRNRFMTGISLPHGGKLFKMKNQEACDEVRALASKLMIEYPLEAKANVPFTTVVEHRQLSPKSQAIYDDMAEQGVVAGVDIKDGQPLGVLEIKNYLTQLSSGFIYEESIERVTLAELANTSALELLRKNRKRTPRPLFTDRIDAMAELYQQVKAKHPTSTVLVCYHYKYELEQLTALFPMALNDMDKDFESLFNTGMWDVGLLQYQRSSKSVNLQKNCHVMIQYSQTFNFEDNYQIVRRIARQGQEAEMCYIYKLHFDGTADDIKTEKYTKRSMSHEKMRALILR